MSESGKKVDKVDETTDKIVPLNLGRFISAKELTILLFGFLLGMFCITMWLEFIPFQAYETSISSHLILKIERSDVESREVIYFRSIINPVVGGYFCFPGASYEFEEVEEFYHGLVE